MNNFEKILLDIKDNSNNGYETAILSDSANRAVKFGSLVSEISDLPDKPENCTLIVWNNENIDKLLQGIVVIDQKQSKFKTIKTIDVNCLEWFDRVNGNSYFAGRVTVNYGMADELVIYMPFQYGYGSQYEQEAKTQLVKAGFIEPGNYYGLQHICREAGIIYRGQLTDRCKQRELKAISKLIAQQEQTAKQNINLKPLHQ